jgi:hypothetical protein
MTGFSEETVKLIETMERHFLVPLNMDDFLSDLDGTVAQLRPPYDEPGRAFGHNLTGVVSTVTLPFALAASSVRDRHTQRFYTAERIRARSIEAEEGESESSLEERRKRHAQDIARERVEEFVRSEDGKELLGRDISEFLIHAVTAGGLADAAAELIVQGAVLAWGALEVLARDVFITYLNENPQATTRLLTEPSTRKRFEWPKIPMDLLAEYKFDLSESMGSLLSQQQDMSDLGTIKAVYAVIFPPHEPLLENLNKRDLWILSQQRHLIVHRRGVIDKRYLENTGSMQEIGTRLTIEPATLERYLKVVRDTGRTLVEAIPSGSSRSPEEGE